MGDNKITLSRTGVLSKEEETFDVVPPEAIFTDWTLNKDGTKVIDIAPQCGISSESWHDDVAKGMARHAMYLAYAMHSDACKEVEVVEAPVKAVVCRAAFKKGELQLVGVSNRITTKPSWQNHDNFFLLGTVLGIKVYASQHYMAPSKEGQDSWITPYWKVPRCEKDNNMKQTVICIKLPWTCDDEITFEIPALVNSKAIQEDTFLIQTVKQERPTAPRGTTAAPPALNLANQRKRRREP